MTTKIILTSRGHLKPPTASVLHICELCGLPIRLQYGDPPPVALGYKSGKGAVVVHNRCRTAYESMMGQALIRAPLYDIRVSVTPPPP